MATRICKGYPITESYSTQKGLQEYNKIHNIDFLNFIKEKKLENCTLLDMGCGNGHFSEDIKRNFPGIKAFGLDKKNYFHKGFQFVLGDARYLPFKNNSIDLIVSTTLSQWIKNDNLKFYKEIQRVISPEDMRSYSPAQKTKKSLKKY